MTMIQMHIDVQKCELGGGGMLGEYHGIGTIEPFKDLDEGVGTMKPQEEDVIDKMQAETGLLKSGVKEFLFKDAHEQLA